ncbi:cytochrome c3 family protein [Candidatus Neomarinimicrobiota bacterium]
MSPRIRKRLSIVIAVIVIVPFLFYGAAEFTSRPKFCNTCHYMEPFYESWQVSSHSDISCTYCHFEPGLAGKIEGKLNGLYQLTKYVSLAYKKSKPWAEISDASCTRKGCHQTQNLEGPIQFKNVKFDHSHHLGELRRGKQLRCTSCHSQMVQGSHILVTEETCFLCHMKDRDQGARLSECRTCHTDEIFLEKGSQLRYNHTSVVETEKSCQSCHVNTVEGNAPVSIQACINCHWQTDFFKRFDDPEFLHMNHVTNNKVECIACHMPILHRIGRTNLLTGEDCRSCHQDMHMAQAQLFSGVVADDVPQQPNPMYEAGLSCQSCHIFHAESIGGGETMVSSAEACDDCHGKGYSRILQEWEQYLDQQLTSVQEYLTDSRNRLRNIPADSRPVALLDSAAAHIQLVTTAKGIHNIQLSDHLLQGSHRAISAALRETGKISELREYISSDKLVPSDCANCHYGIEQTRASVYNLQFRHDQHLSQGVTCTKCHSNLRRHGELLLSREECLNCHHSQEKKACSACHREQQELLSGQTPFFQADEDLMWQADIRCPDCHLLEAGIVRKTPDLCADCHDEDYPEMVLDWRQEIQSLLGALPKKAYAGQIEWLTSEGSLGGHNPQAVIDYLELTLENLPRP